MISFRRVLPVGLAAVGLASVELFAVSGARSRRLAECLPSDVLAAYVLTGVGSPPPDAVADPADSVSSGSLLEQAQSFGLWGTVGLRTRQWLDALTAFSLLFHYPHAVALFDLSATPREDGGHQLAGLCLAVIVETGDDSTEVNRLVQHLLDTYTNAEHSTLTTEKVGTRAWMTLRDQRLPPWAVIQWAFVGHRYIISIGDGSLRRVIATMDGQTPGLPTDHWFASASHSLDVSSASFWLFARLAEFRRRGDRKLARKISDVLTALRLADVSRGLWTTRHQGRALEMSAYVRRGPLDEHDRIADRRFKSRLRDTVIPEAATHYAIIDCNPVRVVRGIAAAYLASRSPAAAKRHRAYWRNLQATSGIDLERDILQRLGHTVVIYDYPPYPIHLPLAQTMLIRVDREPAALRQKVDELLTYTRNVLIPPGLFQLRHTDDNVWHVAYGLNGPALTVLDRWVIIGFTPAAVREIRRQLQPEIHKPPY